MVEIEANKVISAPLDRVWSIVPDVDGEPRYWQDLHSDDSAIGSIQRFDYFLGKYLSSYIGPLGLLKGMVKPFETKPAALSTKKAPGFCITCSALASTMALFQLEDAVIIQRYCDKCLPSADYVMGPY